jgi:hypothetical protein
MVQLKYYGDDRDYFKYDLISFILEAGIFSRYGFVPMLTEHRYDNEGNVAPAPSDCKSKNLLDFITEHSTPDLNNWESWLRRFVASYDTVQPANTTYFKDADREDYWKKYESIITGQNSLIFFDPDTGLQAGRKSRIHKADKEKYILDNEFPELLNQLDSSSTFMVYQHLQWNSKKHEPDINNKIESIISISKDLNINVYHEKDLSFIFITKNDALHQSVTNVLATYRNKSTVNPNGLTKRP